MLSDFDLAKQSGEPGGRPATVAQIEPNGVRAVFMMFCSPSPPPFPTSFRPNFLSISQFRVFRAFLHEDAFCPRVFVPSGLPMIA